MKALLISFALFLSGTCIGQAHISGANPAQPGSTEYYSAYFDIGPHPYSNLYWTVTGGTITNQSTNPSSPYCIVDWDTDPMTPGTIAIYEDLYGQETSIEVMPGGSYEPFIAPNVQYVNYGSTPGIIYITFSLQPPSASYQWEVWNTATSTWNTLPGQTNSTYQPAAALAYIKYRCVIDVNGSIYYPESDIWINSFNIGYIDLNPPYSTSVNYNTSPSVSSSDATGGYCYSYLYTWEYSVEDGPWFTIGTSSSFPVSAPPIIGKTAIRRRVSCGGTELISNVLVLYPNYTAIDYENRNYVREITVATKGIVSWANADAQAIGDKFQSTTYLDGLGRPIQTVEKGVSAAAGNTWKDMVKHYEYDEAGRTKKNFLPYATTDNPGKFKTNAATAQQTYILSFFGEPTSPAAPTYSLVEYDESPLNRVLKSMAPGKSWAGDGKGVSGNTDFNNVNEKVHIWNLDYTSSPLPVTTSSLFYGTGTLLRNISTDEKGNKVITYTDLAGNAVLKKVQEATTPGIEHAGWVCTYYVYDDLGRQRFVITPKAVAFMDNVSNWTLNQTMADELCFRYLYDEKGRMVAKKQAGVLEQKMLYDKKDRLVLTQHANQDKANNPSLTKNQWTFVLYDDLNRTVATGLLHNDASQSSLKGYIDGGAYQPASATILAFVGTGNQSLLVDYPIAGNSGSASYLPGTDNIIFNAITHYDNYSYNGLKSFNATYTLGYSTSTPNIELNVKTNRTTGRITGEKTRILDGDNNNANDKFLFSTAYYDEVGRTLESLVDNSNLNNANGADYQVNQYDFSGKLMSSYTSHKPNASTTYTITSKNEFDKIGRLTKLSKYYNGTATAKDIAIYNYDELGQLKTKRLAPGYPGASGSQIELLTYDYNIHGWLTGINKDYTLSENNYGQWDKYFGMYIGYDNRLPHGPGTAGFTNSQFNGNITGLIWKSQGDNTPRKFDFEYDNLDRFTKANYKQRKKPSESIWLNTEVDFSTTVEYEDGNGNLKSMKHFGIVPGINNGVVVDDLRYTYLPTGIANLNSNMLQKVEDLGAIGNNNGVLGDFKDVVNTQDYWYDKNGNLVKDLNKNIKDASANGVTYNFMNKPDKIVIDGKSTIFFTYDASGEKLKKRIVYANGNVRITNYIGGFVYEEFTVSGQTSQGEQLQYVLHEEGRLKIVTPHAPPTIPPAGNDYQIDAGSFGISNWPGSKQGVFEYFIKDHLGSTRMVLTEEIQKEFYVASMEHSPTNLANAEEKLFGQVDLTTGEPTNVNELRKTRLQNNTEWPGNTSDVAKLTATAPDKVLGPNMILKVMAGDIIRSDVKYYYVSNNNSTGSNSLTTPLINSFINALSAGKGSIIGKNQSAVVSTALSGNGDFSSFLAGHNQTLTPDPPKAYVNVVFFDEQFKFIETDPVIQSVTGSNFKRVSSNSNPNATLTLQQKAPKNGWVFVFLSNESDQAVYFDNFAVTQEHSRIAEETHYYPYGQKIGGISSKAFNKLANKYNYQGDFSENEEETGWDEFDLRMYDPQIGRWTGVDPFDQYSSGYTGMGNDPINRTDPDGGTTYGGTDYVGQMGADGLMHYSWDASIHNYDEFIAKYGFNSPVTYEGAVLSSEVLFAVEMGFAKIDFHYEDPFGIPILTEVVLKNTKSFWHKKWVNLEGAKVSRFEYENDDSFLGSMGKWLGNVGISGFNGIVGTVDGTLNLHKTANDFVQGLGSDWDYLQNHTAGQSMRAWGSTLKSATIDNPHFTEDVAAGFLLGRFIPSRVSVPEITITKATESVFIVTREGVVLPKGAKIPGHFLENPYRSSNYGLIENGKFVEKLRIDGPTPLGKKGPNFSHYHLNGSSKHLTGGWPWW